MTYYVTVRDIVHGHPENVAECPVARAIRRRHPSGRVNVSYTKVLIGETCYNLPGRVWRWIDSYDAGESVRPMRFELL